MSSWSTSLTIGAGVVAVGTAYVLLHEVRAAAPRPRSRQQRLWPRAAPERDRSDVCPPSDAEEIQEGRGVGARCAHYQGDAAPDPAQER